MKKLLRPCVMAAIALASLWTSVQAEWYEDVKLKGDFRYRWESIEGEDQGSGTAAETTYSRQRLRLRYGAYGKVNETTDFGIRLATAGGATSTNETFDNGLANMAVAIDLAYVDIEINDRSSLTVGKMKNPFYRPQKSQRVWDGDVTPEGLAYSYGAESLFGSLAYVLPDSDNDLDGKEEILGAQIGVKAGGFKGAFSYYKTSSDTVTGSVNATLIANDGDFMSVGAEYEFDVSDVKATVYAEYVSNQDGSGLANAEDATYEIGVNLKGDKWKAGLAYMDAGGEGVTGFQDNDFLDSGDSGVNGAEGFRLSGGYKFAKNSEVGFTYFSGEQNVDSAAGDNDFSGMQADLKFKF
mgnify:CR=1 FL=1